METVKLEKRIRRTNTNVICTNCNRERKHYAKGLCNSCYVNNFNKLNKKSINDYNNAYLTKKKAIFRVWWASATEKEKQDYNNMQFNKYYKQIFNGSTTNESPKSV